MKTDQEVLEAVSAHLLAQGEVSQGPLGNCRYRGPRGLKCALGFLISDEAYSPDLEDHTPVQNAIRTSLGFLPSEKLLRKLQQVHDIHPPHTWKEQLKWI